MYDIYIYLYIYVDIYIRRDISQGSFFTRWVLKVAVRRFVAEEPLFAFASEELGGYMESKGASSPGILALTTSLSKPFTRLERYPALLKELDRHMEVSTKPFERKRQTKQVVRLVSSKSFLPFDLWRRFRTSTSTEPTCTPA